MNEKQQQQHQQQNLPQIAYRVEKEIANNHQQLKNANRKKIYI